jgi:eukaryotic-like serine/threonine-protein kinase
VRSASPSRIDRELAGVAPCGAGSRYKCGLVSRDLEDPNLGKVLAGRYRLLRDLGAGQMARVYVAEQLAMGRNVAIKLLLDEVRLDDMAVARFVQEVFAVARLRSPHTIQFYDAGVSETGAQFIAMELLAGETLRQRLNRDGSIPPYEAVGIAAQVGASLQEAHEAGVLHRDLKPENIFLCSHPTPWHLYVKVLDFGLAKIIEAAPDRPETRDGYRVGTPAYMAPEMIVRGRRVDHRADVYALGLLCFEMLTGRRAFEARGAREMAMAQVMEPIPRGSEVGDLPPEVDSVFDTLMAKDPEARPQQATDVAPLLADALARTTAQG